MGGTTIDELNYSNGPTRICGQDELYAVDVVPHTGKNRVCTSSVLIGGTDGAVIGNIGDKLNVTTSANDGFGIDAFGRLRVAEAQTIYTFIPRVSKQTETEWDESTTSGGTITFNANNSTIDLQTTTTSGSKAIRQTFQKFIYTPGKSNIILMTVNLGGKLTNCRKRIGLFDEKDGWFFELNGQTPRVVVRSNIGGVVNDYPVNQANWNFDKLDGTGPSGITLDFTKTQIIVFDYQWLGIGRVRFGFVVNGFLYYCHYANHANLQDQLYSQHPHVPFRAEIENTDTTSIGGILKSTCFSLAVEGGGRPVGRSLSITSGTTEKGISTTETYLFSISLQSNFYRHLLEPIAFQFNMSSGTKPTVIRVYENTLLTNPSWTNIADISRVDRAATAWSGGKLSLEYFVDLNTTSIINVAKDAATEIKLGAKIDGTPINMTVTAQTMGGNGNLIYSTFVREYI